MFSCTRNQQEFDPSSREKEKGERERERAREREIEREREERERKRKRERERERERGERGEIEILFFTYILDCTRMSLKNVSMNI